MMATTKDQERGAALCKDCAYYQAFGLGAASTRHSGRCCSQGTGGMLPRKNSRPTTGHASDESARR
jgi:hypothetical protein